MIPGQHTISSEAFAALARSTGGTEGVRHLVAARLSKTMLLIRDIVRSVERMNHEHAEFVRQAYTSLSHIQRHAPSAVRSVLEYPIVSAWALRCALVLRHGEPRAAKPHQLAAIAAAAAVRGSVNIAVDIFPWRRSRVHLPSLGTASLPWPVTGSVSLQSYSDGAEIAADRTTVTIPSDPHLDGVRWQGIPRVSAEHANRRLDILLDSTMPRRLPAGLTPVRSLADSGEIALWRERLLAGWRLLASDHPAIADEIADVVRVVAPLRGTPAGPSSATLGDAFGCVVMSLPSDELFTAVTLTHETQHAKLTALTDLAPLVDLDSSSRFYAPWRDDPRPAMGLLHGLYAHLGIATFWHRQRHVETGGSAGERHAQIEFSRWSAACREVTRTLLDSGTLTSTGRRFVAIMNEQLVEWIGEPVPGTAVAVADQRATDHRMRWARRWAQP